MKQYLYKVPPQTCGTEPQTQRVCVGSHGSVIVSVCATNDLQCLLHACHCHQAGTVFDQE